MTQQQTETITRGTVGDLVVVEYKLGKQSMFAYGVVLETCPETGRATTMHTELGEIIDVPPEPELWYVRAWGVANMQACLAALRACVGMMETLADVRACVRMFVTPQYAARYARLS